MIRWTALVLVAALALVGLGCVYTRYFVRDGLDRFMGADRDAAREALIFGEIGCLDHPAARLWGLKLRVIELRRTEPCDVHPAVRQFPYVATIQAYTAFGVRTRVITWIGCDPQVLCQPRPSP